MQSERNEILESLYRNKKINQLLGKLNPAELREDAKQDLFLILGLMPEEKFIRIHKTANKYGESGLIWWSIRTLCNMLKSDRSTFARMYRTTMIEFVEAYDPAIEVDNETISDDEIYAIMNKELSSIHWYERTALGEYVKSGSILKLSRDTGIPYGSLFKTIKITKKKLRDRITEEIAIKRDN